MNLYIKQQVFTFSDKFSIYDEAENEHYYVQGELFGTLGKKLHLFNTVGLEVAYIEQKWISFLPKYYIYREGSLVTEVVKKLSFFHPYYTAESLGWTVSGDVFDHEYSISENGRMIAKVSKQWLSFGDTYELRIASDADEVNALAVALVIDACLEK